MPDSAEKSEGKPEYQLKRRKIGKSAGILSGIAGKKLTAEKSGKSPEYQVKRRKTGTTAGILPGNAGKKLTAEKSEKPPEYQVKRRKIGTNAGIQPGNAGKSEKAPEYQAETPKNRNKRRNPVGNHRNPLMNPLKKSNKNATQFFSDI
ncbi:hypothetical protein KO561_14855 [Radiobacillus kanasensis]|uniref:hypothetical protein n=1 Tax=Radiobacillus kanasensis TaxID=2844358 RepID=UPI001E3D9A21|nr:hypothetical protein [Radiobacillus kanasensis]UFT98466.1 hypothetical protein KO561_14855 [Radiobacillus kanasensis]